MFDVQVLCSCLLRFNSLQAFPVQELARCLTNAPCIYWKILEDTRSIACFLCPCVFITSVPKATFRRYMIYMGDTACISMLEYGWSISCHSSVYSLEYRCLCLMTSWDIGQLNASFKAAEKTHTLGRVAQQWQKVTTNSVPTLVTSLHARMCWHCIHHILQRASKLPFGRLSDWFTMPCSAVLRNHDVSTTIFAYRTVEPLASWESGNMWAVAKGGGFRAVCLSQDLKEVSPPTPVLFWKPYLLNLIHTILIHKIII